MFERTVQARRAGGRWLFATVDDACAILFRHPTLQGIPDLVVEGDGYTMEFMGRLLAEPIKQQLPVGLGDLRT